MKRIAPDKENRKWKLPVGRVDPDLIMCYVAMQ